MRSMKSRVGMWAAMRTTEPGITNKEIAERLGISPNYLSVLIHQARKDGWLKFNDPLEKLEYEIIPKAVENLGFFLDARDKQVTIEVAKGTLFKQFQDSKGISDAPQTVLALKIEAPDQSQGTKIITGQIVGVPRQLEE